MHQLELPALRSDSPLGFLAALGILELTTPLQDPPPRLSWHGPAAPAILHTQQPLTHTQLAELLRTQLPKDPLKEPLSIAPGILSLPREKGAPNDVLRMPIHLALARLRAHTAAERDHGSPHARWFAALVNQLRIELKDSTTKPGRHQSPEASWFATLTPLFAPAGQMTLTNNWTKAAEHCHAHPEQILTALTNWQRVDGYAGANLDHFSTGDAHMVSHGKPTQQGVPGATWLALHAFATIRLTGTTRNAAATSWDTTTGPALTWPIWHPPLTRTAITTLLEHPAVRNPTPKAPQLDALGVTALYTAPRTRLANSYGPLKPGQPLYP
ncbi:hypothetical protein ACFXKR_18280 [Streptomyces violascens]|uniref:type I-G CRISPR-associated protein, Cas3-extension family n=1 Tax=Streptomyces violascens TaxID=67381 RepID=UPI0036C9B134